MNDQADFTPQVRNSAIWSGDSRKVANGKMVDVILEKQGKKPLPDLSDIEAVQMGHIMQPTIGKLAQQRLGIELKDADYALAHPTNECSCVFQMIPFADIMPVIDEPVKITSQYSLLFHFGHYRPGKFFCGQEPA